MSPSGQSVSRVDLALLRTFAIIGLSAGLAIAILGLATGESGVLARSIGPVSVGSVATIQLLRRRTAVPALVVSMGVVVLHTSINQSPSVFTNAMLGVVGMGVAMMLIAERASVVYAAATSAVATLLVLRFLLLDEAAAETILYAVVGMVIVLFTTQLVGWTRREIRERVEELEETQAHLERLVRAKDEFIASVSHELRTPLTAVIGLAEELRGEDGLIDDDEREELVSVIADQAIDVGHIVEDLLVAARSDIGTVSVKASAVDVGAEIRQIAGTSPESAQPHLDIDPSVVASADEHRFRQIMRNLLSNAARYGGQAIAVSARSGDEVVIEVSDDGDGIPEELRETVFEPYETAHPSSGVTGSVGLGLTVSRRLARLMGGDLTYRRKGRKTVFRLTLPPG